VTSRELVLTVRRAGKQSEIRYRIVEPSAPDGAQMQGEASGTAIPSGSPASKAPASSRAPTSNTHDS